MVLCEDGRASTLGRARDPEEADILRAEEALRGKGLAGWLAIQSYSAHAATPPIFLEVRTLGRPAGTFADAVKAFLISLAS